MALRPTSSKDYLYPSGNYTYGPADRVAAPSGKEGDYGWLMK